MTALQVETWNSAQRWTCPLPLHQYDRTVTLSPAELQALEQLVGLMQRHDSRNQHLPRQKLQRLTRPLQDVLDFIKIHNSSHQTIINALLREMFIRKCTLWGWTHDDWVTILATIIRTYRFPTIAIAYLLGNYRDLRAVRFNNAAFAKRIFGEDVVEATLDRLTEPMYTWGYSNRAQDVMSAICAMLLINGSPHLEDLNYAVLQRMQQEDVLPRYRYVVGLVSRVLFTLGMLDRALPSRPTLNEQHLNIVRYDGVPERWARECRR